MSWTVIAFVTVAAGSFTLGVLATLLALKYMDSLDKFS